MGGNAFPRTAQRMTSTQHAALHSHSHAHTALVPHFVPRAEALGDARTKADHGDLDLIAGWADERAWNMKGEERGEVDGGMGLGGIMVLRLEKDHHHEEKDGEEEMCEEGKMVRWAYDLARALKAKEWIRRGSEISFAIPCHFIDGEHRQEEDDTSSPFYQLDVPLVPVESLDFYLITVSYSTTFLILARAVRCISRSLTLQMVGLLIRHSPYPLIPGIDVQLTPSAIELCSFLGLDMEVWKQGFETELECWEWLTQVKQGGMLEVAYKKMVRPRAVRQKGHKKKAGGLDAFVDFLRGTEWGEGWDEGYDAEGRPLTPTAKAASGAAFTIGTPPLSPSGTAITNDSTGPLTPSTSQSASASAQPNQGEAVQPDHPIQLDERAEIALDRWSKRAEYEASLAERKVGAAYLYERQQLRIESKARAQQNAARKAQLELEGVH